MNRARRSLLPLALLALGGCLPPSEPVDDHGGDDTDDDRYPSSTSSGEPVCIVGATEPCFGDDGCVGMRECVSGPEWSACECTGMADGTAGSEDSGDTFDPGVCLGDPGEGCGLDTHCIEIVDSDFGGCLPHSVWDGAAPVGEPGTPGAPCGVGGYCEGGECLIFNDYDVCGTFCQPASCAGADEVCIAAAPCGGVCWLDLPVEEWPVGVPGELWSPCFGGTTCDEGTCVEPEDIFYRLNIAVCMPLCE